MSDDEMANVIGVSRNAYQQKMKSGRFTPDECKKYCSFFGKRFEFLFATNEDPAAN